MYCLLLVPENMHILPAEGFLVSTPYPTPLLIPNIQLHAFL